MVREDESEKVAREERIAFLGDLDIRMVQVSSREPAGVVNDRIRRVPDAHERATTP